jgi:hypothetical protein
LQQHFIGWFIKAKNLFLPEQATFHGFFCGTKGNTYVCSAHFKTEALLNIFRTALEKSEYEQEIQNYIQNSALTTTK